MGFSTAVATCFRKYADFTGRARRSEYWYFTLFNFLTMMGLALLGLIVGSVLNGVSNSVADLVTLDLVLVGLYGLGVLLPGIAVAVRRFHDLGVTGWFVLIFAVLGLIPIVTFLVSLCQLIWFCLRGTIGENNYGPDPYDPDPAEVFS